MQLTINISDEQLYDKVLWLLKSLQNNGLEIIENSSSNVETEKELQDDGLDFSSLKVESFKDIDGLEYQKQIRDEC
jgi:hypothetical protein